MLRDRLQRGLDLPDHHEALDWLRERASGSTRDIAAVDDIEEVAAAAGAGRSAAPTRLRHRRRGGQSRRLRAAGRAGRVARDPRWAIAYKFAPTTATDAPARHQINVGRTGVLTPFAVLEPVEVGGVTVERATLHNEDDIRRKDMRLGDDGHPAAGRRRDPAGGRAADRGCGDEDGGERARRRQGTARVEMPETCPACGTRVVREPARWPCAAPTARCPAQLVEGIKHFVSKGAMDIDGLGEKLVGSCSWRSWSATSPTSTP